MSLDGAITNLASWAGNTMMPTMAGLFFAGAVYRYSKGGQFEQLLYGGFASLMCSGMLRALEGFVQHAGATSADGFWMATMSLVNWVANVILPVFALTQLAAMALHMGGVIAEIYPGSTWIRKFVAANACSSQPSYQGDVSWTGVRGFDSGARACRADESTCALCQRQCARLWDAAQHLHGVHRSSAGRSVFDRFQVWPSAWVPHRPCAFVLFSKGVVRT